MRIQERSGIRGAYEMRDFNRVPGSYNTVVPAIIEAADLKGKSGLHILDLMSGPGKLMSDIFALIPDFNSLQNRVSYLDFVGNQLLKISGDRRHQADVRHIPYASNSFDRVLVRYGIKDVQESEQLSVFREVFRVLKSGGIFVIADMVSPESAQAWLNAQHGLKQQMGGRDVLREGTCHIPTETEWQEKLTQAGFAIIEPCLLESKICTQSWSDSRQITPGQLDKINHMILGAPEEIIRLFKITEKDSQVYITYPLIVLKAVKNLN
jgi:ubiquinone/menaquinone biosynthesis C-methylase UbiE